MQLQLRHLKAAQATTALFSNPQHLNLKKLEDLNISWVKLKQPQLLGQMTWLKRLWATRVGLTDGENKALAEALADTQVYVHGLHPTEGGWRQAKNYYDMRDLLGMHYME